MEPTSAKAHPERMAAAAGVVVVAAAVAVDRASGTSLRSWPALTRKRATPPKTLPAILTMATTLSTLMVPQIVRPLLTLLLSLQPTPRPMLRKRPAAAVIAETAMSAGIVTIVVAEETVEVVVVMIADPVFLAGSRPRFRSMVSITPPLIATLPKPVPTPQSRSFFPASPFQSIAKAAKNRRQPRPKPLTQT